MFFWILYEKGEENTTWIKNLKDYLPCFNIKQICFNYWTLIIFHDDFADFCTAENYFVDGFMDNNDSTYGDYRIFKFEEEKIIISSTYYCTKNCFYWKSYNKICFSSDLRCLFNNENIKFEIDIDACKISATQIRFLDDLQLPDGMTYFKKIKYLDNKTYELLNAELTEKKKKDNRITKTTIKLDIHKELVKQIQLYNITGNVGIELSGGVDSACVLAAMLEAGIKSENIYAFIMTFEDTELANTNDVNIARKLVNYYHIHGYIINADKTLTSSDYNEFCRSNINGPVSSANYRFLNTVSQLCYKHEIKIVFNGNGGDEIFGGCNYIFDEMFLRNPVKTLKKLYKCGNKKFALKRIKNFIIEPLFFKKLYVRRLWSNEKLPEMHFYSKEQNLIEKKMRKIIKTGYKESAFLKRWGRRFAYDFSKDIPSYFNDYFDNFIFASPIYCEKFREYIISIPSYSLFDINNISNSYRASKKLLRNAYQNSLPDDVIQKNVKTTYNQMTRKMFANSFKKFYNLMNCNEPVVVKYNIVGKDKFLKELQNMYILCEDASSSIGIKSRYIMGICELELWLEWCQKGKDYILQTTSPLIKSKGELLSYEKI